MTDNNLREAARWMNQAIEDYKSAQSSLEQGHYEWACFQSQQSAEKALKSLLYANGHRKILTHSVYELLRECFKDDSSLFENLRKGSRVLDSVYITTRYPDSIAGGLSPFEYYEKEDAEECLTYAERISFRAKTILGQMSGL